MKSHNFSTNLSTPSPASWEVPFLFRGRPVEGCGPAARQLRHRNYLDLMSQLCGSDILAYDYCGYGFSSGEPSEESCYESIEAWMG